MKNYLLLLLIVIALSCKKAPDLNPNTIRLTKVETYSYPNNYQTFDYLVAHTDEFKPNRTEEYFYDSQARPVEMRLSYDGQLRNIYKAEYTNGQISKVTLKGANESYTADNSTTTLTWAGDSVIVNAVSADGSIINSRYEFNAKKLPIRKVWRRTNYDVGVDLRVVYDEQDNIKTLTGGGQVEEYEYDLSKFSPYACSNEMRWFANFTGMTFEISSSEKPTTTNWVSRSKIFQNWREPSQVVIETNPIGFVTKTKTVLSNTPQSVRLFYYN